MGANVAVHLGEEAQHPELLKTPPHRANKAAGAYNALDTTLAELSEQRVQLTNPSATAEGSEREPAERLELRSCVHLGQARELATFRLGERRGRKRDFRYRRFATIDLEMRRCKLPCALLQSAHASHRVENVHAAQREVEVKDHQLQSHRAQRRGSRL